MPLLSDFARRKKIDYFLTPLPREAVILEVGCGAGWVGEHLRENGWRHYRGVDLKAPADLVGDIRDWRSLGLEEESCDVIIAFEVLEHFDLFPPAEALLKPRGRLLVTTPLPGADWIMRALEIAGLNQKRTSPHSNLQVLADRGRLRLVESRRVAGLSQWGIFEKDASS